MPETDPMPVKERRRLIHKLWGRVGSNKWYRNAAVSSIENVTGAAGKTEQSARQQRGILGPKNKIRTDTGHMFPVW
jgi:hypothetical protein